MNVCKKLGCLLSLLLLAGCVYKMEIQQGNLISPAQANALELGMSEQEVRNILGTPLLQDPFSEGRWDYVYQLQVDGELVEQRRLTVFFTEGYLTRIERAANINPDESDLEEIEAASETEDSDIVDDIKEMTPSPSEVEG